MDDDYQVYISDVWGAVETLDSSENTAVEVPKVNPAENDAVEEPKPALIVPQLGPLVTDAHRLWAKLAEPPDISYRWIIGVNAERIDELLKDHDMHFEKRCLMYEEYDAELEWQIIMSYENWVSKMREIGKGGKEETGFYEGLQSAVGEEWRLAHEWYSERRSKVKEWSRNNERNYQSSSSSDNWSSDNDEASDLDLEDWWNLVEGSDLESENSGYATANEDSPSSCRSSLSMEL